MFSEIKTQVQKKFKEISATNQLFFVQVDRDKIWQTYLDAIPEDLRQSNNCNCCKSFLRQYGGIVGIKDNKMITLWDFEVEDPEYKDAIKALKAYISSLPIGGIFLNTFSKCGTDKNPDHVRNLVWQHFYVELPGAFVKSDIGPIQANALGNKDVLKRSLDELTDDAVDTVLELIGQNSLYRGNEFKGMLVEFQKLKAQYKKIKNNVHKDNFCWANSVSTNQAVTRIRNTSIGTLLQDLSEGKELDKAVTAFERVVAPASYKRPVNLLVTPRMVEEAKKRLEELGLIGALNRRLLSDKDLNINNAVFVDRPVNVELDVFDEIKKDAVINPKSLSKVEEISIKDFIENVLPASKGIKVLVENRHAGNFVSLVGPKENEGPSLFKWGNSFSWAYTGGISDSVKERVKAAGGNVDGVLRASLAWSNSDDLDLAIVEPGGRKVDHITRTGTTGCLLDTDANGGNGMMDEPVENIFWKNLPTKDGIYKVMVNNYNKRGAKDQGYTVELDFQGQTYQWSFDNNNAPHKEILKFEYSRKNGVTILTDEGKSNSKYISKDKWKISSGKFHKVKSVLLSPNHWSDNVGNKHYFFMLDGCKTDEKTRSFMNEFLKQELDRDRKVFELLGGKCEVESVENELSGIGFSETIRNEAYFEVQGAFKRILKVKF